MSQQIIPEIRHLRTLIERLPEKGGDSAASVVIPLFAEIVGVDNDYESLSLLYRALDHLPALIADKFPEKGRRAAALGVVEQLKDGFSPLKLARPYPEFGPRHGRALKRQLEVFPILEDLEFDTENLKAQTTTIVSEIEKMRLKVGNADDLSDASRTFLNAQLALMERAVLRFETTGVGPFRDSVLTAFGKIYLELSAADSKSVVAKELIDNLLRLYGLLQAGGDILKLTGPVISGLLNGPSNT